MNIIIIGATSEIAKEIGRLYAEKGNKFLLIGRDISRLESLKSDFATRGASAVFTHDTDISNSHNYNRLLEVSLSNFDKIDLLIIAHGSLPDQMAIESDYQLVESYAQINFLSYISLLTLFSKQFERQQSGTIAVFSSVAGDRGRRSNYIYGSFKAGKQAFVEGFSARMSRAGVHVLDIRPGMVDTPMTAHLKKGLLFASPSKVAKDVQKSIINRKNVLYTPFFWRYIMVIIRNIPRKLFYKLNF